MFRLCALAAIIASAFAQGEASFTGEDDLSTTTTAAPTDWFLEQYRGLSVSNASNDTATPAATPTPTASPTPAPTADIICDNWADGVDGFGYGALTIPAAWGNELPLSCASAWQTDNAARYAAFGTAAATGRRLSSEDVYPALEEQDEQDEPDAKTMTTAEPTVESWSADQRSTAEFLSAYRGLSAGNDTNVTVTPNPTSAPTAAPTPAPTACPVEEMNTFLVEVRAVTSDTTAMTAACQLELIDGVAAYLNYPYAPASAKTSDEVGLATEFFSLDPAMSSGVSAVSGVITVTGMIKVNIAHTTTITNALKETTLDNGCAYQLGVKIEALLSTGCPTITSATLVKLTGSATDAPTPQPTGSPTPEPTGSPTPVPTAVPTAVPTYDAAGLTAAVAASQAALEASGNVEIPVEVELTLTPAAFNAMKAVPQASALALRDGFALHIGATPSEVIIPPGGINPSIGDFALGYDFGRRLALFGRELSDFSGKLAVTYNVAVPASQVSSMTSTLQAKSADAAQLTALTSSINTQLINNVGAAAAVTGAVVTEIKAAVDPNASPTPKPTPKPTDDDDDDDTEEESDMTMVYVGLFVVFVLIVGGGAAYAYQQQQLQEGGGGAAEAAPRAAESPGAAPALPAATSPAGENPASPTSAGAAAQAGSTSGSAPIDTLQEPHVEIAASDDQVQSAAVQIDDSSRATQCCVVCG